MESVATKRCSSCRQLKPATHEYFSYSNKKTGRLHAYCRECNRKKCREQQFRRTEEYREKARVRNRARYQADPDKYRALQRSRVAALSPRDRRAARLKTDYGITIGTYDYLMARQEWCCAICRSPFGNGVTDRPHVDHDHSTDQVRGLLCGRCNVGLGCFRDDVNLLGLASIYLMDDCGKNWDREELTKPRAPRRKAPSLKGRSA